MAREGGKHGGKGKKGKVPSVVEAKEGEVELPPGLTVTSA